MKSKAIWSLLAINALLLGNLVFRGGLTPAAHAQGARPSDYLMIPGQVVGGNSMLIYIVDTRQGMLSARTVEGRNLVDTQPVDLNRIFGRAGGR
jgi:hypothetical protein